MKTKLLVVIALLLVTVLSLSSCRLIIGVVDFVQNVINPKIELTDAPLEAEKIIDFANGANPDVLFESDGWSNGDVFNVVWKKHNVFYGDGIMRLGITEEKATAWIDDAEVEYSYTAGEARTQNYYHYGDYEVSMKPSANPGTASTFFTCTGPYDTKFVLDENGEYMLDENGQRITVANPHDEIDIEFLGKDTTHVQFNFFVDGKGGNEYMHELGFDASEDFHTYGYRWTETSITWFVDGEPVYKVTTDTSVEEAANLRIVEKIPQTPGRMLTNYWCGNERAVGWMGLYTGNTKDQGTEYQWMATSAQGAPLNPPEKPDDEVEGLDWSKIDAIAPTFETTELYTVTTEGTSANITYTEVGGSCYKNVEMDITEASAGKNYLHLVVTNNGENPVRFRVNVVDMALVDAGAQNMSTNDSATVNGNSAWTDHEWGGSFFDLAAGETYEIVIVFKGEVEKLQLMPDSSKNDSSVNAGNITISEIKFATVGEVEKPDEPQNPSEPVETPTTGDTTALIDGVEVNFGGNTEVYGINANDADNTVNVKYNKVSTNTYLNVNAAIASVAAGKTDVSVKIKNNGTETVYITVKLEAAGAAAIVEGKMEIPAGEEHTYNGNFAGVAEMLYFFIDTGWSQETTIHKGDVTITEIHFSGEGAPVDPPVNPPVNPPVEDGLQLNFWTSSSDYTVNGNNIKYNGLGNSYSCAGSADIVAHAAGKNTFTVTITNNGTATSRVRIDIQGENQVGNHSVLNTGATGGDVWTDAEWGGSTVTVEAGASVTLVITYDIYTDRGEVANLVVFVDSGRGDGETYNSDITLSGMAFSGEATPPVEDNSYDIAFGEETVATGNPGVWYFWNDQNWCGSNVTAGAARYDASADKATFTYSGATPACWHGYQAFYKYAANELGKTYKLTCTIISESAGDITINGKVVTLVAGENSIELTVTEGAGASFTLQCGNAAASSVIAANTFSIAGLTFTAVESGNEGGEGNDPVTPPSGSYNIVFADETNTVADPGVWHFWNDQWWCGSNVTVSGANYDAAADKATFTYSLEGSCTFGMQIFYKNPANVAGKNYKMTCIITSEVAGDITINGQTVSLVAGDNNIELTVIEGANNNGQDAPDASFALQCGTITANTISISNLTFTAVGEEPGGEPTPDPDNMEASGEYVKFAGNDCYTITAEGEYYNICTIAYNNVSDNTYQNINTWIKDKAEGKTKLGLIIGNNGTETVVITVKLEAAGAVALGEYKMTIAPGEAQSLYGEFSGEAEMLYLFIASGWSETTATHSGTITLTGIAFN